MKNTLKDLIAGLAAVVLVCVSIGASGEARAESFSVAGQVGASINKNSTDGTTYYLAPRIRGSVPFYGGDFISAEVSLGWYKVSNFLVAGDGYNVVPIAATLRATITVGPVRPFVYAGLMKNFADGPLSNFYPALGLGVLVPVVGPFNLRADAGWDGFYGGFAFSL